METQTCRADVGTQWGKGRVGQMERVIWKYMHCHVSNRKPVGICYKTQGAQTGALWQPRGVRQGEIGGREHIYTYGWLMLMYGSNQYNTVKQLSSNYKWIKFVKGIYNENYPICVPRLPSILHLSFLIFLKWSCSVVSNSLWSHGL